MRILLTGGTGFVGRAFANKITSNHEHLLRIAVRRRASDFPGASEQVLVNDISLITNWRNAVLACDIVVHTAARVHVMRDTSTDPLSEFRRVNVDGTLNLAQQAAAAGVKRFVHLSSVKVNGEETTNGQPFQADNIPNPQDDYGTSKHESEFGLRKIAVQTGMEVVIIRPPLVYGPGVKANFLRMMNWLYRGVPLPLGAIHNQRSLVALDNLINLILTCLTHPAAANQTFLAADGEDLSTTDLLRRMAAALGRPARLLPVPAWLLTASAMILGKSDLSQRLCSSLQVDISKNSELLGWIPPVKVDEALRLTAEHYLKNRSR